MKIEHQPVLLEEVLEGLNLKEGLVVFDGTLGSGGYSEKILEKIGQSGILIATDLDSNSIKISKKRIGDRKNFLVFHRSFEEIGEILKELRIDGIDRAVLDLGWSMDQFRNSGRGLSFQNLDEDLDMNLSDKDKKITAWEILNYWDLKKIEEIIKEYGEERGVKKIVEEIGRFRRKKEIKKVKDLVEIIEKAIGKFYRNKKIHPATKTFQALRIYINNELGVLERSIEKITENLKKDGLLAIVTFHSLEDRLVKRKFLDLEKKGIGKRVNKKVIKPSYQEILKNKRARSAKLRIFRKII